MINCSQAKNISLRFPWTVRIQLNENLPNQCIAVDTMNLDDGFIASKIQESDNVANLKLEYATLTSQIAQMRGCLDDITVNEIVKDAVRAAISVSSAQQAKVQLQIQAIEDKMAKKR